MSDQDLVMAIAYRDCLEWAISDPDVTAAFARDTGIVTAHRSPLSIMIDAATGYDRVIAERFIAWFNENVWGEPVPAGVFR